MQMDNEFAELAPSLYSTISIYVMFLIKQLYRHLPSTVQLLSALDARFHLINTFQLGDVSRASSLPDEPDLHLGCLPAFLLHIIYYILLGFYCAATGGCLG